MTRHAAGDLTRDRIDGPIDDAADRSKWQAEAVRGVVVYQSSKSEAD